MDSGKSVRDVSTPLTVKLQAEVSQDDTPKLDDFSLKQRHLDFNSGLAQEITFVDNTPKHGPILTPNAVKSSTSLLLTTKVVSNNDGKPQTDQKKVDNDVMIMSPPAENFKITLDKKQLTQLLNMEIERRKADERKEQREKKEAELSAKREAKRKKEEERLRQQSEKMKAQQLQREQFLKFFKPSNTKGSSPSLKKQDTTGWAPTFPVQPGMTLAKSPSPMQSKITFDDTIKLQEPEFISSYITNHKRTQIKKRANFSPKARPFKDDDIIIVDEKGNKEKDELKVKFKLLQFCENYRPAYYGTCQKLSKVISPRNPFKKDESLLDYTVDSDEEWEEEEPGESLSDCPSGDEGEDMEEEDDEDGFLVPHGYLSDDEGDLAAESADLITGSGDPNTSPKENRKEKMKMKEKAWEMEFARKCQPLKPFCIGCYWTGPGTQKDALLQYQAVLLTALPVTINFDQPEKAATDVRTTPKAVKSAALKPSPQITKKPVPEEAMSDLIKLLQGSSIGLERTIKKFRINWGRKMLAEKGIQLDSCSDSDFEQASGISKRQLEMKISQIAKKVHRVWQVDETILKKYAAAKSPSSSTLFATKSPPDHTKSSSSPVVQSYHNNNQFIQAHHLKENHLLPQKPSNSPVSSQVNKQDESPCGSPANKRLKLTETQHVLLVQT